MSKFTILAGLSLTIISTSAFAADLYVPAAAAPVAAPMASGNWDGPYIGLNVGYGPGTATFANSDELESDHIDFSGVFGGVQAGYNFSLGNGFVMGLQGDITKTNETGSVGIIEDDDGFDEKLNWTAAVTGRIGYDAGGFMPYALAGVAFANNTITYTDDDVDSTNNHVGYVVGAGLEAKVSDQVSVFGEVRYADYGTRSYGKVDADVEAGNVDLADTSVRIGMNYHF